jgi:hypothetical protein
MQTAKANDKNTLGFIGGIIKQHGQYRVLERHELLGLGQDAEMSLVAFMGTQV